MGELAVVLKDLGEGSLGSRRFRPGVGGIAGVKRAQEGSLKGLSLGPSIAERSVQFEAEELRLRFPGDVSVRPVNLEDAV